MKDIQIHICFIDNNAIHLLPYTYTHKGFRGYRTSLKCAGQQIIKPLGVVSNQYETQNQKPLLTTKHSKMGWIELVPHL